MRYLMGTMLIIFLLTGCGTPTGDGEVAPTPELTVPLPDSNWSRPVHSGRAEDAALVLDPDVLGSGWAVAASLWPDQTITFHSPTRENGSWRVEPTVSTGGQNPTTTEWLLYAPPQLEPTSSTTPVSETSRSRLGHDAYLLHGLLSSGQAMTTLAARLRELGLYERVIVCTYRDERPIVDSARDLVRAVNDNTSRDRGCDLIAHSLGGLVSRYAVEQLGLSDRVRSVWMLGTPHLGSDLAGTVVRLPLEEWLDGSATGVALLYAVNATGHLDVLRDLASNSDFIKELSWGPRVVGAKYDYLTLGGDLLVKGRRTYTDGVVSLGNATWSGLGLHARSHTGAIVPVSHGGLIRDERAFRQLAAMMRVRANQR